MAVRHFKVSDITPIDVDAELRTLREANRMEMYGLLKEIRLAFPTCSLGRTSRMNSNRVAVYLPDAHYAMGWVGYGAFRYSGDQVYVVYSRKISNGKYSYGSDPYYMRMSSKLPTTISNAKAFLRPFTHLELAESYLYDFTSKSGNAVGAISEPAKKAVKTIQSHDHLMQELMALHLNDYKFINAEFNQCIEAYMEATKEAGHYDMVFNAVCIRVGVHNGTQVFDTIEVSDAHSYMSSRVHGSIQRYEEHTLPTDYLNKLSMLMTCAPLDFIHGVGLRVDDEIYYVVT